MMIELRGINKTYNNGAPLHVLKGIDLDSNVPTENEYMKRYSAENYAYRLKNGMSR